MSKLSRRWRRVRQAAHEMAGGTYELDSCSFSLPSWADDVKRNIRRGNYERPERELVRRWLQGDRPVIELGGAFGIVSGVVGTRLRPDTPQVVVEANPALADICRRNAGAARPCGAPVAIVQAAICYDGTETASFVSTEAVLGSRLARADEEGTIQVPATTLSRLLAEHARDTDYDLICDIEGTEFDLFEREAKVLARCRLAIVELHPDAFAARGASEDAFLAMLSTRGLEVVEREANVIAATRRDA